MEVNNKDMVQNFIKGLTKHKINYIKSVDKLKNEQLWQKSVDSIKSKKNLFNFEGIEPIAVRNEKEMFLSDDVSFIIAENKKMVII